MGVGMMTQYEQLVAMLKTWIPEDAISPTAVRFSGFCDKKIVTVSTVPFREIVFIFNEDGSAKSNGFLQSEWW